jgi:pimeloyl-ACP methyl ester carboxylesterase
MQVALARPDRVARLVLLDSLPFLGGAASPTLTADDVRPQQARMRDAILAQSQEDYLGFVRQSPMYAAMASASSDVERIRAWALASDKTTVAHAMFAVSTTDLRPALAGLRAPTLVLGTWAGYAPFATREQVEGNFRAQYAMLPGVKIELAERARHFLMLDEPEWTYGRMEAFLAATAGETAAR